MTWRAFAAEIGRSPATVKRWLWPQNGRKPLIATMPTTRGGGHGREALVTLKAVERFKKDYPHLVRGNKQEGEAGE